LRKVVKAKPQKKIKETDAIFDNIKKRECVPPFTHDVFNRAVRLTMSSVICTPRAVTPHPPC
jgi:hypothetical protein